MSLEIGDRSSEGLAWGSMGIAYDALGEGRRAIECFEQQLKIAQEIGDRCGEGAAWGNMGNARAAIGEIRYALKCREEQLVIACETGDLSSTADALFNSALDLWKLAGPGERQEARRRMAEAADIYAQTHHPNAERARQFAAKWSAEPDA